MIDSITFQSVNLIAITISNCIFLIGMAIVYRMIVVMFASDILEVGILEGPYISFDFSLVVMCVTSR